MKHKIIYGLISLLIAFAIWAYVITVVSPESEATFYNVPVVLNNETVLKENGLMVVSEKNPTITLVLSGNRSDLNTLKSSDITVIADLAKINEAGEKNLSYSISFPGNMAVEVISNSPEQITLSIAERSSKEVDVVVKYIGEVPKDYIVDEKNTELNYPTVSVTGPKNVVDQITQLVVDVDVTDATQTISQAYSFTPCDAEGNPVDAKYLTYSVTEVNVTVRVLLVKEVDLVVATKNESGVSTKGLKIEFDPRDTIMVAGSERVLEELEAVQLGTVDLADILEDSATYTFEIHLPEGVRNYSGITEVTVTVSFEGMKTTSINVTDITDNGTTPEGLEAILPPRWEVLLRGPEEQIGSITSEDLKISIDLSGAAEGSDLFTPVVTIDSQFPDVEVIFVEDISVTLRELPEVIDVDEMT